MLERIYTTTRAQIMKFQKNMLYLVYFFLSAKAFSILLVFLFLILRWKSISILSMIFFLTKEYSLCCAFDDIIYFESKVMKNDVSMFETPIFASQQKKMSTMIALVTRKKCSFCFLVLFVMVQGKKFNKNTFLFFIFV